MCGINWYDITIEYNLWKYTIKIQRINMGIKLTKAIIQADKICNLHCYQNVMLNQLNRVPSLNSLYAH